jgi:hypothetical protein
MPKSKKSVEESNDKVEEVVEQEVSEQEGGGEEESSSDNLYEQLKELVLTMEVDYNKFYNKGNAAAGTRVRGCCQNLKKLAQDLRIDVQERKNSKKK